MGSAPFVGRCGISIIGQLMLGATLLLASSCVPPRAAGPRVIQAVPPPTPRQLLRGLALDVPAGADLPSMLKASPRDDAAPALAAAAPAFSGVALTDDDARRAAECLTAAVYYEARSEPVDGQRAVAQVVLNRVRDRAFPHSVCGVVYQGASRRTGCQFSFTCDGSMAFRREPGAWERARAIADAALGGSVYAPVGSATFFHTNAILPWWASSMARIGSVGAHIFYRWRGAMQGALSFRAAYAGVEPAAGAEPAVPGLIAAAGAAAQGEAPYRDTVDVAGVAVHRGRMTAVAHLSAAPASVMASAVRVHVGVEAPRRPITEGAVIGEETDPI